MGTTPISSLLSSSTLSQQQIPWTSQFQLLDKEPLNNTYILHHLPTSISYKIKHLTLNKVQHSQIFRQIDLRAHNPSNFVAKLQKVQQYTVKGYCSEHEEVFLMYKHVENSLKEQILNRRFKRERFTEEEIKVILESGVKGLAYLHEIGCTPKALNTSQILITPQRGILVNDPFLSVGSILAHTMQRQSGQQSQNSQPIYSVPQQEYPSPEKLLYQNDLIEEYNEWLSELFSFGVILLETIFLEPLAETFYDKSQKKIYYHKVKEKIQEIEQNVQLEKGENSQIQNAQNSLLNGPKYNGFQSSLLALSPHKANGLFLLNEIKQDLRRLLSHEPRIRESVYLKYKKNHTSSYQSLNKLKQQSKPNQYGLAIQQYGFKNGFESTAAQNLNQEQNDFAKKYQKLIQQQQSSFADQLHSNNKLAGLEEQQRAYRIDYEDITKRPSPNRFRVVSSSQPHRNDPQLQIPNTKSSFVMPVTSEYLIHNQNFTSRPIGQSNETLMSSIQSKPLFHHLGRSNRFSNKEEHKPDINVSSLVGQPERVEALVSNGYKGPQANYHYQANGSLSLSPNKQTQQRSLYYEKYLTKDTIPYNTKPIQQSPYSSHFNNPSNPTNPTTHQYSSYLSSLFPQNPNNPISTNLSTDTITKNNWMSPSIGLPDNNVTRSQSKYVLQPEKVEKDANNNSRIGQILEGKFDYVEISNNRNDYANISPSPWTYDRMIGGSNYASGLVGLENKFTTPMDTNHSKDYNPGKEASQTNAKISLSHSYTQNKPANTYNYTTTDQYTPSGRYSSELPKQPSIYPPISTNPPTTFTPSYTSTFPSPFEQAFKTPSNFEQWKRANLHLYSQQASKTVLPKSQSKTSIPKVQNPPYSSGSYLTQMNKIPSSKELSHFPIRQVGSINEGESHFLNDKESFVIESYNGGLNHKQSERHERVQTPISTLNSSNIPNISPKNSFQINHSAISNFRNDGKSFSSVDEDLKEFRKFGQMNNNNAVYKPNSSYSSQQKVSVIDKIYDPQVTNSYERRSFENSPQKNQPKDYQGTIPKARNSQNVGNRASQSQNYNSRTSSQNYLQTPERYPGKNRLNSTIRQASCEQSGVNQSNSNNDSYQNEKVFPNTEVSKYQAQQDRRMSERKPDKNYEYEPRPIPTEQKNPNQTSNAPTNNDTTIPPSNRVTLYADGSRYMGQTDDQGQSHGYGILYYPDGQVAYQGQWTHGDFNGKGKLFNPYVLQMAPSYDYKDLTRMDEYIKEFDGVFVKDVKQGMGMLKMHNEEIYCGEFVGDLPHGRGKFYCSTANVIDGVWEQGLLKSIM